MMDGKNQFNRYNRISFSPFTTNTPEDAILRKDTFADQKL